MPNEFIATINIEFTEKTDADKFIADLKADDSINRLIIEKDDDAEINRQKLGNKWGISKPWGMFHRHWTEIINQDNLDIVFEYMSAWHMPKEELDALKEKYNCYITSSGYEPNGCFAEAYHTGNHHIIDVEILEEEFWEEHLGTAHEDYEEYINAQYQEAIEQAEKDVCV